MGRRLRSSKSIERLPQSEAKVQADAVKALRGLGYIVVRTQVKRGQQGFSGEVGMSDYLVLLSRMRVVWLEFKSEEFIADPTKGLDHDQKLWRQRLDALGHVTITAASAIDAVAGVRHIDVSCER